MNHLSISYNRETYECTVSCDGTSERCSDYRSDNMMYVFKYRAITVGLFYNLKFVQATLLASETVGADWQPGSPSQKYGLHLWIQFLCEDGTKTPWIYCWKQKHTKKTIPDALYWVLDQMPVHSDTFSKSITQKENKPAIPAPESPQIGQTIEIESGNKLLRYKLVGIKEKSV